MGTRTWRSLVRIYSASTRGARTGTGELTTGQHRSSTAAGPSWVGPTGASRRSCGRVGARVAARKRWSGSWVGKVGSVGKAKRGRHAASSWSRSRNSSLRRSSRFAPPSPTKLHHLVAHPAHQHYSQREPFCASVRRTSQLSSLRLALVHPHPPHLLALGSLQRSMTHIAINVAGSHTASTESSSLLDSALAFRKSVDS